MKREIIETAAVILLAAGIIGGAYLYVQYESGVDPTFTNVESQSMQHMKKSQFGIIDTGDMVILKDKNKADMRSYVEGRISGFSSFGEYGSVVVYERGGGQNPVIHRIILWLDYNSQTGHWSAPTLKDYNTSLWSNPSNDWNNLYGKLELKDVGYSSKTVWIDLDILAASEPKSGYLTLGDNKANSNFDQSLGIMRGLIPMDKIRSVAWIEIPWGGIIKLANTPRGMYTINEQVPDAIPSMAVTLICGVFLIVGANYLMLYRECTEFYKAKKKYNK